MSSPPTRCERRNTVVTAERPLMRWALLRRSLARPAGSCSVRLVLIGDSELDPALRAPALQDKPASLCVHPRAEPERASASRAARLKRALHNSSAPRAVLVARKVTENRLGAPSNSFWRRDAGSANGGPNI